MSALTSVSNRRVLVAIDDPVVRDEIARVLSGHGQPADPQPFDIATAAGSGALTRLNAALAAGKPYALAFVDLPAVPDEHGMEAVERLRDADPHLQLVLSGSPPQRGGTTLPQRLGRDDGLLILSRPCAAVQIRQCALTLAGKWQSEAVIRQQNGSADGADDLHAVTSVTLQMQHYVTHDPLTGLPNRALLADRLAEAMSRSEVSGQPLAVLLVDLDRFKLVNDSLGHRFGDEYLTEVARRLKEVMRGADTVARLGADEFVMMLGSVNGLDGAVSVAERALTALAPPIRLQDMDLPCAASIGIALYPADAGTVDELFNRADAAMHYAKKLGGNRVSCFDLQMNTAMHAKVKLEVELRNALSTGQLELHYQPKVDTLSGAVHSAEALIRWRHPQRGLVPPNQFIPLAEECGLIGDIGEWVVREACRQTRAWQKEGLPPLRVAVNLSPTQFRQGNLLATMRKALDDAGLDARYLEVELTENTVMADAEGSVAILERLSEMGVLVSVDDFGTGYSSMSYLRRFPVDKLKIDRAFISEIVSRPDDASIVRAIVSLAHSLRLKVVAEGVETLEQLEFLQNLGCDQYQGFYFSPAIPPLAFATLLRETTAKIDAFMDEDAVRTHSKLAAYRR